MTPGPIFAPNSRRTATRKRELICHGLYTKRSSAADQASTVRRGRSHEALSPGAAAKGMIGVEIEVEVGVGSGFGAALSAIGSPLAVRMSMKLREQVARERIALSLCQPIVARDTRADAGDGEFRGACRISQPSCRTSRAGTPAHMVSSGQSSRTTALAAMTQPRPIVTPGRIVARAPTQTPAPIETSSYLGAPDPARQLEGPVSCVDVRMRTSGPIAACEPTSIWPSPSKWTPRFTKAPSASPTRVFENRTPGAIPATSVLRPTNRRRRGRWLIGTGMRANSDANRDMAAS